LHVTQKKQLIIPTKEALNNSRPAFPHHDGLHGMPMHHESASSPEKRPMPPAISHGESTDAAPIFMESWQGWHALCLMCSARLSIASLKAR
jgi:hypothetical protein